MRVKTGLFASVLALAATSAAIAQTASFTMPKTVTAGQAFSVPTSGNGSAMFYIVGLGQTLARKVALGQAVPLANGTLTNAGLYMAILVQGASKQAAVFTVTPGPDPAHLAFLARPSRLPVNQHNGITGAVYVYDAYHNLILAPNSVSFHLTIPSGATQTTSVRTRDGAAWTAMNSSSKEGVDQFIASTGQASSKRVIQQVPGTPCNLTIIANPLSNGRLQVKTNPVRDCSGNPVPDGTIVTFTATYGGEQSIADVPIKKGIAQVELPARKGATLSAASGVALGNQIRWER